MAAPTPPTRAPRSGAAHRRAGSPPVAGRRRPRTDRPAPPSTPSRAAPPVGRPTRRGRFLLPQVVVAEVAATVVLASFAGPPWLPIAAAMVAALLVLPLVLRLRQRWLVQWVPIRMASRRRAVGGAAAEWADPSIAPVLECRPALRTTRHADRTRRSIGIIGDGTFLTAVLALDTVDNPMRPPAGTRQLPLGPLVAALRRDDIPLGSVQLVQHTQPTPATHVPGHAVAVRSHQQLGVDVPAVRSTWIAVRLEPERCPEALVSRGGGALGARRALVAATQRLAADLEALGLVAEPLNEAELVGAIGAACSVNPMVGTQLQATATLRRTRELRRAWRCDDRWHATFWVSRWPRFGPGPNALPAAVATLTNGQALATTFGITLRRDADDRIVFAGHVRVSARSETHLGEAVKALESRARQADAGLVRLDGEQLPGVLATLPLGGSGRAEASRIVLLADSGSDADGPPPPPAPAAPPPRIPPAASMPWEV